MDILQAILFLLAGTGVLILGMNFMSGGLEKSFGKQVRKILDKISDNKLAGVGIGALVAGLIQSSGATTAMVIGFVNSSSMSLVQATSIIMGANIGTTITGLLVSLSSFNIEVYFCFLAFIGCFMIMLGKNEKIKSVGSSIGGLGIMFTGLYVIKSGFNDPLVQQACFNLFEVIDFPLVLLLIGIILTAFVHSSGLLTSLAIIMCGLGVLPIQSALFIVLGSNIGTCVTALISSIGTNANAKRAALIHLLFNCIGTIFFTALILIFKDVTIDILDKLAPSNLSIQIALFHIIFNLITTLILLPSSGLLVKIAQRLIKDKEELRKKLLIEKIDDRFLNTPSIALNQVRLQILEMAKLSRYNLENAMRCLLTLDLSNRNEINEVEDNIDYMNEALTSYLIKLTGLVSVNDSNIVGSYFHVINDIERIGDIAKDFLDIAISIKEKELCFSKDAINELTSMYKNVNSMFDLSYKVFKSKPDINISELDKLENIVDNMKKELDASHFERLAKSNCTMELGAYFTSVVSYLERVADHLVNIGYSITSPTGD